MESQTKQGLLKRADRLFFKALELLARAMSIVLPMWAVLVFAAQCMAWLKAGIWQPVPFVAVFISDAAKNAYFLVLDSSTSPLDLALSLTALDSPDTLVTNLAGRAVGVQRILVWLLLLPLTVWLLALALLCTAIAVLCSIRADDLT